MFSVVSTVLGTSVVVEGDSVVVVTVVASSVVVVDVVVVEVVVVVDVVVVVVVVVVVCSFGFTIVFVTVLSAAKSAIFTSVSGVSILYPGSVSTSVSVYLSFNNEGTVIFPLESVTYSPIT